MPGWNPLAMPEDVDRLTSAQLSILFNSAEVLKAKSLGRVTFKRVAYLRISKDKNGAAMGVHRQYRAIMKHCGDDPIEFWYVDNDTSAYSGVDRPDYLMMRADMENGVIDARGIIWTAFADRIHRNTVEAIEFMELCFDYRRRGTHKRDIVLFTSTGPMNFHTADGRQQFVEASSKAEWYSAIVSEKVNLEFDEKVERGEPLSGKRKFGYKVGGMEHEPAEARAIVNGAQMVLAGRSLSDVARNWTHDRHLRTPLSGNPIDVTTVRLALTRPATAGLVLRRGKTYPGSWKPILDRETWEAVRVILLDPSRKAYQAQGAKIRWLGTGLYLCGGCGTPLYVLGGSYRCKSIRLGRDTIPGAHVSRIAAKLDEYVDGLLLAALLDENIADKVSGRAKASSLEIAELHGRRAEIENQIDAYRALIGQPGWGPAEIGAAVSKLSIELEAIERELVADVGTSSVAQFVANGVTEAAWGNLPVEGKRAILSELGTLTVLKSARGLKRLDPQYLSMAWNV